MPRGGKRANAGRKPNPLKTLKIGAESAERLLVKLKEEQETLTIYTKCGDWRLKWIILEALRDRAYGKAVQPNTHGNANGEPFKVIFDTEEVAQD